MPEPIGTVEELHAAATKSTGLRDFGDAAYLPGLTVLLRSLRGEAQLTAHGAKVARSFLTGALVSRALSEASWRENPAYADVPIERPLFVVGLPRTGITALHRLIAADPAHQGVEMWLTEMPQPRPPRASWDGNPVYRDLQSTEREHHVENPEFMGVHFRNAGEVKECGQLLRQSMQSITYESVMHVPSYSRWLREQDMTPAYQRHRRNLQLIGLHDADRRWVLKNPSHLFSLDALLAVYPDALMVQTHRAPQPSIAATCGLNQQASAGWSEYYTGANLGHAQLDLWTRGLAEFARARSRYDPDRFFDVDYSAFTADPLGTVERIYAHFALDLSPAARTAMESVQQGVNATVGVSMKTPDLSDFGLTAGEVDARFADYGRSIIRR